MSQDIKENQTRVDESPASPNALTASPNAPHAAPVTGAFEAQVAEVMARIKRRRPQHERLARLIFRTGKAGGITPRQLARHDSRSPFALYSRTWLFSMIEAGYGNWLRVQPGPSGGRPSMVFVLDEAVAEHIAAEVKSANPTKSSGGDKEGPLRPGLGISLTNHQRENLHRMAKDAARSLSHRWADMNEQTIIDLKKPADLAMVNRAVVNGWIVPEHIQKQISDQMHDAVEHYRDIDASGGRALKQINQLIRICQLYVKMDAADMVQGGRANQSDFTYLQRRPYPEPKRHPRINRERMRIEAALKHKTEREQSTTP